MRMEFLSMLLVHPVSTHDRREHEIRQKNPFQNYKALSRKQLSGELLYPAYRSTEQLAAPILAIAKTFGATGHL